VIVRLDAAPMKLMAPLVRSNMATQAVTLDGWQDRYKQDEIAARQLHLQQRYQGPREKALCLTQVKAMFLEMGNRTNSRFHSQTWLFSTS
jgi:hypothetical protein